MEFLKNRQKVIDKSLREFKSPSLDGIPQILSGLQAAEMLRKHQKIAKNKFEEVKKKAENILSNPVAHDQVYKTFNRIFDKKSKINLCRPKKERFAVRNLARKRFILGYPPRKDSDTSIGDAINWEWIIHCALQSGANTHVMIVSRDSDYGIQRDGKSFINDWLVREFKDRVSRSRKLVLTAKLTEALKVLEEIVTPEDEKEELALISSPRERLVDTYLSDMLTEEVESEKIPRKAWEEVVAALLGTRVVKGSEDLDD